MSPRTESVGNTLVPLETGASSVLNMPTGVAIGEGISFASSYQMPYAMFGLFRAMSSIAIHSPLISVGMGIHAKRAEQFYHEYQFIFVLAKKINRYITFAIRPRWLRISVRESPEILHTGNTRLLDWAVTVNIGKIKFSAYQENALGSRIKVYQTNEKITYASGVGVLLNVPKNTRWMASIESRDGETVPHIGVESWYTAGFAVRMGIDDTQFTIGMGLKAGNYGVDFSAKTHRYLGTTYSTGIYALLPRK